MHKLTVKVQVLEFVAIQRKDTGAWAIPGGMVDPGEKVLFLDSLFCHISALVTVHV